MPCKCHINSPFRWRERQGSIFGADKTFRPVGGNGLTQSVIQSQVVERERAAGREFGKIEGVNVKLSKSAKKNKPVPVDIDKREFHTYSKAGKDKVNFATIHRD